MGGLSLGIPALRRFGGEEGVVACPEPAGMRSKAWLTKIASERAVSWPVPWHPSATPLLPGLTSTSHEI